MRRPQACWVLVFSLWMAGIACDGTPIGAAEPAARRGPAEANQGSPEFTGRFAGQVIGPGGAPVVGARVYAVPLTMDIESHGPVRATTNDKGQFEFEASDLTVLAADGLPMRRQALLIAALPGRGADWITTQDSWLPSGWLELNLQLAADVPLDGRLCDLDGRPIAGGRVRVERLAVPPDRDLDKFLERTKSIFASNDSKLNIRPALLPEMIHESVTDGEGQFHLAGLGGERVVHISATAPGYADKHFEIMTRDASPVDLRHDGEGKPTATLYGARSSLPMEPDVTLRGRVVDQVSRKPIPGMPVTLNLDRRFITDAEGRFTIGGVYPEIFYWMKQRAPSNEDYQFRVKAFPLPGMPYRFGSARIEDGEEETLIECTPGIPFRLRLTDEAGMPVEAEVTYRDVQPSPARQTLFESRWPISQAARQPDGSYLGFVLPGPGAVLVKPIVPGFRPAHVDPKKFFAPGRKKWTTAEQTGVYGNQDVLLSSHSIIDQHDYAAIVLVNPPQDSKPLELTAQLVRDRPRIARLFDASGNEIIGAEAHGLTYRLFDREPTLRTSKVTLAGLHPDRPQRITFLKRDRKLIGYLVARGDGESPYTVVMRPWGKIKGRMVDVDGKPLPIGKPKGSWSKPPGLMVQHLYVVDPDPQVGGFADVKVARDGKFTVDMLVPGQRYTGRMYAHRKSLGIAFEDLSVEPGETRDLGDVRIQPTPLASMWPGEPGPAVVLLPGQDGAIRLVRSLREGAIAR